MEKQNYTPEQIIVKLRSIEILSNQGKTVAEAVHQEEAADCARCLHVHNAGTHGLQMGLEGRGHGRGEAAKAK